MARQRICHRCYRPYTDAARGCPRCGPTLWQRLAGFARSIPPRERLIVAGLLVAGLSAPIVHRQLIAAQAERDEAAAVEAAAAARRAQAAKAAAEAKAAACRADAICTGREHVAAASRGCRRLAEQEGKHGVRWPDIGLIATFVPVKWGDREHRTITYIGQGEFQNGFGAWTPYVATCEFSIRTDNALFIQLTEGRL